MRGDLRVPKARWRHRVRRWLAFKSTFLMGGIGGPEDLDGVMNRVGGGLIELHPATQTIRQQLLWRKLFNPGFQPAPHFDGVSMKI